MTITGDIVTLYMAIMTPILGVLGFLWRELVGIRKDIAATVTHETCEKRRDKCPCVKEVMELKRRLEHGEH